MRYSQSEKVENVGLVSESQLSVKRTPEELAVPRRKISQLFTDGLVGKRFSRAFSFYRDRWSQYLAACRDMTQRTEEYADGVSRRGRAGAMFPEFKFSCCAGAIADTNWAFDAAGQ